MLLGHGAVAEHALSSVRGGNVQNVGSPFISGVGITIGLGDESIITSVSTTAATNVSTFSIGTETVTGSANITTTTAGQITIGLGEETTFGESFQNLISLSTGSPSFFLWNEVDDTADATWKDVEPGSTD
jgi:hypothetical protein